MRHPLKNFKAGNFNLFESVVFLFQKINDTESWNAVYLPNSQMFDLSGMQKLICVPFAHPQHFTELWNRNHIRVLLKKLRKF